jgi:hypothetical protein
LRRSEWNLAENAAATAVAFGSRDTVTGLTRALNLLHKLAAVSRSLTAAERHAVSKVLADQWGGTATQRGDVTDYGIDVQKLIQTGILVETDEGLSVAA